MATKQRRIVIEAGSVSEPLVSGVGATAAHIINSLASSTQAKGFEFQLVAAFNKTKYINQHHFPSNVRIRRLYMPGKLVNLLTKIRMMPPMDLVFGRATYLFPNFKNWPLVKSKSITYVHDVAFLRYPEHIEQKNLAYLNRHIGEFLRRATVVVTVSEHAKREISHFFPQYADKVKVVYNGIDPTDLYPRDVAEQDIVAKKYGLTRGEYFIFISNIEPRKNVEGLLDGFKIYCDKLGSRQKAQLLLVGGMGWNNERVIEKITQMQSEGYQVVKPSVYVPDEDKAALLSGSIGLVHPAFYEGFGLTPLEAMACGKNVAVANNSSLPEVVGDAGIYFADERANSIADGLEKLYNMKEVINKAGIERAKKFTWNATATQLIEIIKEIEKENA